MTKETDAMDIRRLTAISAAKLELIGLDAKIRKYRADIQTAKKASKLRSQIKALEHGMNEPHTTPFDLNSLGNIEGGLSG